MRLPRLGSRRNLELNVTPMIDVVFLLVIFFLVSSHLARQETQVALTLPAIASGMDDDQSDAPRVTLNVQADGTLLLGGERAGVAEIERRLIAERQMHREPLEVRIRADRAVRYGLVEPLLAACAHAGVWNVKFAVTERSR